MTGRRAAARRISSEPGVDINDADLKLMDAIMIQDGQQCTMHRYISDWGS